MGVVARALLFTCCPRPFIDCRPPCVSVVRGVIAEKDLRNQTTFIVISRVAFHYSLISAQGTAFLNVLHRRFYLLKTAPHSYWRKNRFVDTVNYQRNRLIWHARPSQKSKLGLRVVRGACVVHTELVSIGSSHNSLRRVRGWKKTAEMQEVLLVSGQTLCSEPFSVVLTRLTAESTTNICLSSSLSCMAAAEQAGRAAHAPVGSWPTTGSPLVRLRPSQLRAAPGWAHRQVSESWRSTKISFSDMAALPGLKGCLK